MIDVGNRSRSAANPTRPTGVHVTELPEPVRYPLAEAPAALRLLETRSATGKIALDLSS